MSGHNFLFNQPWRSTCVLCLVFVWNVLSCHVTFAQSTLSLSVDLENPPFSYSDTEPDNAVSRLIAKLQSGQQTLEYDRDFQYLPSLLEALEIPVSSQTLVFSKTSLQVRHISRRNPRAIFFNDDIYVGWIRGSSLMEISVADPRIGTAFYAVNMTPDHPQIERAYYDCLSCHATSMTGGVPGHTVRSVMTSIDGSLVPQRESYVSDHRSPMTERFGGWYVTGRHGDMTHMGNSVVIGGQLDRSQSMNRLSLRNDFDTFGYPTPYSDIVALMVLQHQTQMHNALIQADFSVRQLRHERLDQTAPDEFAATIDHACKHVLHWLLFCDEAKLTSEVKGTVLFRNHFEKRGPADPEGRSLRQFNLTDRLFEYPCSYLIYSSAFTQLDQELKDQILVQLRHLLLARQDQLPSEFLHLEPSTRNAIHDILTNTHDDYHRNRDLTTPSVSAIE